jgi:hypothetical protein
LAGGSGLAVTAAISSLIGRTAAAPFCAAVMRSKLGVIGGEKA